MHRKCLCPYLCQSMSVCVTIYRDHVWLSSLPVSIKVLSHKVTCHSDMSTRQNHIHVTWGDSMPQQVAATVLNNPFPRVCSFREGPQLVYLQTCHSDMSQVHVIVTRGDGMCLRHFDWHVAWIFKLIWIHATSHGVELHQNNVSHEDLLRGCVTATGRLV